MNKQDIPAFPFTTDVDESKPNQLFNMGMTLRDYFAAAALTGLLAANNKSVYGAVEAAYNAADYMLVARNKRPE